MGKKYATNGFRFQDGLSYNAVERIHSPNKKCADCADFVSVITLACEIGWSTPQGCANPQCFKTTYKTGGTERRAPQTDVWAIKSEFLSKRLGPAIETAPDVLGATVEPGQENLRAARLILWALVEQDYNSREWFLKEYGGAGCHLREVWDIALALPAEAIRLATAKVLSLIVTKQGPETKEPIGRQFGVTLKDWVVDAGYLRWKDEAALRALAKELKLLDDPAVVAYVSKQLKKPVGKVLPTTLALLDKKQLKDLFLKSGVDLAGKVPKEILGKEKPEEATEDGDELDAAAGGEE
jgi:hypothetical protein